MMHDFLAKRNIKTIFLFKEIVITAVLMTVIYTYFIHFLGSDLKFIFGDLGDARLNNYFLEHGFQYLTGNHTSFWNAPFYYPAQNVMTYSDNHLGTLPFYALFRVAGYDIETSYQLWMLLIFLLNGFSSYIVLRLFRFNRLGSFAGAMLFTIAAPILLKTNHFQLMPRFMVPFLFYTALKYVESLNIKYFYLFCLSFVYQFYIGIYIGFFAIIALILMLPFLIVYLKNHHNFKLFWNAKYVLQLMGGVISSAFLLFLLFEPYLLYKEASGGRSWEEISTMLPHIKSWFYTSGCYLDFLNQIGTALPMQHEHVMFLGFVPYLLFLTFFLMYLSNPKKIIFAQYHDILAIAFIIITFAFIFTVSIHGFSLYKYTFYQLPGFDAIRAVTRIVLFLAFPFAIILAFSITAISNSILNNKLKYLLLGGIIILGILEQYRENVSIFDKKVAQSRYLGICDDLQKTEDYDILYLKRDKPSPSFYADELDAMFVSAIVNKPTINGYSGNFPKSYELWNNNDYAKWVIQNFSEFADKKLLVIEKDKRWKIDELNRFDGVK